MSVAESGPRIIVGVDESATSHAALEWAAVLARQVDGTLGVYSAWNYPTALMMPVVGAPVLPPHLVEDRATKLLTTAVACTPNVDPETSRHVVMGAARFVLTEASANNDLLVLGRSDKSHLKQLWLGSTASYCTRHAKCPVVVVRDSRTPEHRITVAVDGSEASVKALAWALSLGDAFDVTAVYSYEEWELSGLASDHRQRSELPPAAMERLDNAVSAAGELAGVDTMRVKQEVRRGDARSTIVDDIDAGDMLVVGAHGHSALSRWFLGSFADYAVNAAPGTVVIWRDDA